ncbi:MAG: UDP-N-acetylmuramate dehydrogenase [Alphaproteobacteria bacterium]
MMAVRQAATSLIDRLPPVRGRLSANAPLDRFTWFRVGGPAEVMFRPADADDLAAFLAAKPDDVPATVIGVGSNLLVRDGGVPGVVIRLGGPFALVETEQRDGRRLVHAGAGALDLNVALTACEAGIAGLEFLSGIPGTIGGALRMNGGAFGSEMAAVTREAETLDGKGARHRLGPAQLGFSYRHSAVPADHIFIRATLEGQAGEREAIKARMDAIAAERAASQPLRTRTGGSTFTNPSGPEAKGRRAWELIDAAGCRGLRRGGAMVSEKHCNFLINTGEASAADIEGLGEEVRRRVFETSGVRLEWEIRRIGVPLPAGPRRAEGAAP